MPTQAAFGRDEAANSLFQKAVQLRKDREPHHALEILGGLLKKYPNTGLLHYEYACCLDVQGLETEAAPYYERALSLGLPDETSAGAYIGLGSTYRTIGKYEESKRVLEAGIGRFPDNRAIKTFYALTLYNLRQPEAAVGLLLRLLLESTDDRQILAYRKALAFYSDKLDEVWN